MVASLAVVDAIDDLLAEHQGKGLSTPQGADLAQAVIKWPNDVLIAERKVAGILVETSHDRSGRLVAILGIGVNVHQLPGHFTGDTSSLLERATSLEAAYGQPVSRERFIARLIEHIEASYFSLQPDTASFVDSNLVQPTHVTTITHSNSSTASTQAARLIRERWRGRLTTLGCAVQVRQGNTLIEGFAEDVNESGELLLRLSSGERITISWGDIGYPTGDSAREQ
jgi:BirA family biotin operon repressor/biotin-[acetyl-CoA-carboxylase] ligase